MKIVKKGKIEKGEGWEGKKITCDGCGCVFQLERGDRVKPVDSFTNQVEGTFYTVKCPKCRRFVDF